MSRTILSAAGVGNDVLMHSTNTTVTALPSSNLRVFNIPVTIIDSDNQIITVNTHESDRLIDWNKFTDKHRLIILGILSAIALVVVAQLFVPTWYSEIFNKSIAIAAAPIKLAPISKVNLVPTNPLYTAVPTSELEQKMQQITSQNDTLVIGAKTVPIPASTISTWVSVTSSPNQTESYLRVDPNVVSNSISQYAAQYVRAPIDSVAVTEDGIAPITVINGSDGTQLSDPATLSTQSSSFANSVLGAKNFSITVPIIAKPSLPVAISSLGKVIVANVTTKKMYAYENGQLVKSFLISAGKPSTPTPLGEFHIWEKLPVQNMSGYNPDGSKYIQPNVQWISYFDHRGDAIHGNYWRPASWFGAVNSSHGCLGVQNTDAEWVYNWAPIGTTVITHS